jgi:transposase
MPPVVEAYQAMRGASFLGAVTFAEIGDVRRFDTPRQLASFLGLVPAESSTGDTIRRKGLTLAGNRRARRALIEAAWTYRYPARVSETLRARLEGLPKPVRDIGRTGARRTCQVSTIQAGNEGLGDRLRQPRRRVWPGVERNADLARDAGGGPSVRPLSTASAPWAKKPPVVVAAIAREIAAFLWAIGREVAPA